MGEGVGIVAGPSHSASERTYEWTKSMRPPANAGGTDVWYVEASTRMEAFDPVEAHAVSWLYGSSKAHAHRPLAAHVQRMW